VKNQDRHNIDFGDARDAIRDRAIASGLEVQQREVPDGPKQLRIQLMGMEDGDTLAVSADRAELLLGTTFENWVILGNEAGGIDRATGSFRAYLTQPTARTFGFGATIALFAELPGVEYLDRDDADDDIDINQRSNLGVGVGITSSQEIDETGAITHRPRERSWRLPLVDEVGDSRLSAHLEFSPVNPRTIDVALRAQGLYDRNRQSLTLNVEGLRPNRPVEEMKRQAEEISAAFFFNFDMLYGVLLGIARRPILRRSIRGRRPRLGEAGVEAPTLPRRLYTREATGLYFYARSAGNIPLIEYLAYYQILEFHFPSFYHRSALTRLRNELADPRFKIDDDRHLARLIRIGSTSRPFAPELDQLRATIEGCLTDEDLTDFIGDDPDRTSALNSKTTIKHVSTINSKNRDSRITAQVARRIYEIRCRIVHSKEDGGPQSVAPLFPFSPEARALISDLDLIRFVAQKVIVAESSPRLR
jgi:hypothetical protein